MDKLKKLLAVGLIGEFIRYTLVGLASFAIDYGTLLVLNKLLHVNYLLAAIAGFVLGTLANYVGSVRYAFARRAIADKKLEWIAFVTIGLLGLGLNELLLYLLTGRLAVPVQFSKPLGQLVVFTWNFSARKLFLFSEKTKRQTHKTAEG